MGRPLTQVMGRGDSHVGGGSGSRGTGWSAECQEAVGRMGAPAGSLWVRGHVGVGPFLGPGRTHSRTGQKEPHRQTQDYREVGVVSASFPKWTQMRLSDHGVALVAVAAKVWLEGGPAEGI